MNESFINISTFNYHIHKLPSIEKFEFWIKMSHEENEDALTSSLARAIKSKTNIINKFASKGFINFIFNLSNMLS